jgi:hypothetical protein
MSAGKPALLDGGYSPWIMLAHSPGIFISPETSSKIPANYRTNPNLFFPNWLVSEFDMNN